MVDKFSKKEILDKVPSEESLEENFLFIKDDLLRQNISIALRYITFLTIIQDSMKIKGTIQYSIYKTIILYTASIVESSLLYCLKEFKRNGKIKDSDIMNSEWKYYDVKTIYKIPESVRDEDIIVGKKYRKHQKLANNIQFQTIIRASLKCKILNKDLVRGVDKLKDNRNKIHLTSLKENDDYFTKRDIIKAFTTSNRVLKKIEYQLSSLIS
ncbi:hypothetical protein KAI92_02835 [Candidatus Parcubacteria bacterium]|nr:hypothetical protein [Candidatus Parcubacteria bacterium]